MVRMYIENLQWGGGRSVMWFGVMWCVMYVCICMHCASRVDTNSDYS